MQYRVWGVVINNVVEGVGGYDNVVEGIGGYDK